MQFGIVDAVVGSLRLTDPPRMTSYQSLAMCPLVRVMMNDCPAIHIPFLSPKELSEYVTAVDEGHHHMPLSVEESYIRGGKFVFNRGKSYLFAKPTEEEVDDDNLDLSQGKSYFLSKLRAQGNRDFTGNDLDETIFTKDTETRIEKLIADSTTDEKCGNNSLPKDDEEFLRKYLGLRKPENEGQDNTFDSKTLLENVRKALIVEEIEPESVKAIFDEKGIATILSTVYVKIEVIDVLRSPPRVLAAFSVSREQEGSVEGQNTQPLLKEDITLTTTNGTSFGEIGIAVTRQFFERVSKIKPKLKRKKTRTVNIDELYQFRFEPHTEDFNTCEDDGNDTFFGPSLEDTIVRMIQESNSKWKKYILYENPYVILLNPRGRDDAHSGTGRRFFVGRMTCFLEPHYKIHTQRKSLLSFNKNMDFRKNAQMDFRNVAKSTSSASMPKQSIDKYSFKDQMYKIRVKDNIESSNRKHREKQKAHITRQFVRETHENVSEEPKITAQKSANRANSKTPGLNKNFTNAPNKGWLRSTPIYKGNRGVGSRKNPIVKLNRTCFLRRTLVDPELARHIELEIQKKLQFRLTELKKSSKEISQKRQSSVGNQTDRNSSTDGQDFGQQTDHDVSSADRGTMVGSSLHLEVGEQRVEVSNKIQNSGTGTRKKNMRSSPLNVPVNVPSAKIHCENPKDSFSMKGKIRSVPSASTDGSSRRVSGSSILSDAKKSFPRNPATTTKNSITKTQNDDLGKTFSLTEKTTPVNIRNASELDRSNTLDSGLSKVFVRQDRFVMESGSFGSFESKERSYNSFPQIEEQSENSSEKSFGGSKKYDDDFERTDSGSNNSVSEDLEFEEELEVGNNESSVDEEEIDDKLDISSARDSVIKDILMGEGSGNAIVKGSGTYSMGEIQHDSSLINENVVINASGTYSLGQMMENLNGIDYNRDSPNSMVFDEKHQPDTESESSELLSTELRARDHDLKSEENVFVQGKSSTRMVDVMIPSEKLNIPNRSMGLSTKVRTEGDGREAENKDLNSFRKTNIQRKEGIRNEQQKVVEPMGKIETKNIVNSESTKNVNKYHAVSSLKMKAESICRKENEPNEDASISDTSAKMVAFLSNPTKTNAKTIPLQSGPGTDSVSSYHPTDSDEDINFSDIEGLESEIERELKLHKR